MKFAIIGSGNIARTYALAVQRIPHAETVAIVSRSARKLPDFSHIPSFKSIASIEPDYDAAIICTPNGLHHISAIEAAERGKHVLCEKPIDISLSAIDRMIDTCHHHKVKLAVAYQRRYSSDNPLVKRLIEENKLGKIFSVNLSVLNYRDDAYYNSAPYRGTFDIDGGGPFIQQASHYIDLYCWLFGKPTKLISKLGTFIHDIEVEDHGAALCTHDSGIIGTITASTATKPGFPAKLEIYSDKGFLILENDIITHWEIEDLANPSTQQSVVNQHTGAASAQVDDTSNHELIIEDFITAVRMDRAPLITGESAKIATEVILDIYAQQF